MKPILKLYRVYASELIVMGHGLTLQRQQNMIFLDKKF
jgi:hypothetical protein